MVDMTQDNRPDGGGSHEHTRQWLAHAVLFLRTGGESALRSLILGAALSVSDGVLVFFAT